MSSIQIEKKWLLSRKLKPIIWYRFFTFTFFVWRETQKHSHGTRRMAVFVFFYIFIKLHVESFYFTNRNVPKREISKLYLLNPILEKKEKIPSRNIDLYGMEVIRSLMLKCQEVQMFHTICWNRAIKESQYKTYIYLVLWKWFLVATIIHFTFPL